MTHALPDAKITVSVVGEDGKTIEGAEVGIGFERNIGFGTDSTPQKGITSSNGIFTASYSTSGYVTYGAVKEGYYRSIGVFRFFEQKMGRWEPWNPTINVVLRKREKPVPMYARDTQMSRLEIPVSGKAVGFDLTEYDWVAPYGKGKYADFFFKLDRKFNKDDDFESILTITFSNKYDGIQLVKENRRYGSEFKLPRLAPRTGYKQKLTRLRKGEPNKPIGSDFAEDNNYIFRVRSEEKDGKLLRAMYGKIQGDIQVEPRGRKTATILFTYYLNPDYSQNLEYGGNLFTNLSDTEQVGL